MRWRASITGKMVPRLNYTRVLLSPQYYIQYKTATCCYYKHYNNDVLKMQAFGRDASTDDNDDDVFQALKWPIHRLVVAVDAMLDKRRALSVKIRSDWIQILIQNVYNIYGQISNG